MKHPFSEAGIVLAENWNNVSIIPSFRLGYRAPYPLKSEYGGLVTTQNFIVSLGELGPKEVIEGLRKLADDIARAMPAPEPNKESCANCHENFPISGSALCPGCKDKAVSE